MIILLNSMPEFGEQNSSKKNPKEHASCDVERSFSKYKSVLSDRREGFTVENLKYVLILNCNI